LLGNWHGGFGGRPCGKGPDILAPRRTVDPTRTIGEELIATLPYWTGGPRRRDGQLYAQPAALTLAQLQARVVEFVDRYNRGRVHGSLGGMTPAEKWATSSVPLEVIEPERLRWMLMADQTRRALKDRLHFGGEICIASDLARIGGRTVEVRYMPHDLRTIEVFDHEG
jgi:putative transposase